MKKIIILIFTLIILVAIGLGIFFVVLPQLKNWSKTELSLTEYLNSKRAEYLTLDLSPSTLDKIFETIVKVEAQIRQTPNDYQTIVQAGVLYQRLHEYDLAKEKFEQAAAVLPGEGLAFANLAELYVFNYKDFDKAVEYYKKAIENDYWKVDNYKSLADLYRSEFPEKKSEIENLMLSVLDKSDGNEFAIYTYLMEFFWGEGNLEKALEYDKKAIKIVPDNEYLKQSQQKLQEELAQ